MPWDRERSKQLGEAVRKLRVERELSQEALAARAGVTKNQIQLIEAGRSSGRADAIGPSNPRMATLTGLAEAMEMSVAALLAQAKL